MVRYAPPEDRRHLQHGLDELLYKHHFSALLNSASDVKTKGRLLLVASSESGAWLGALPVPPLDTKLDNESLRIALGLRLGVPIVVEHTCICGAVVYIYSSHMVCLAGIVVAVFHGTMLSMKLSVMLWCLGVYLLFWSLWVYVVMMVRGRIPCL